MHSPAGGCDVAPIGKERDPAVLFVESCQAGRRQSPGLPAPAHVPHTKPGVSEGIDAARSGLCGDEAFLRNGVAQGIGCCLENSGTPFLPPLCHRLTHCELRHFPAAVT